VFSRAFGEGVMGRQGLKWKVGDVVKRCDGTPNRSRVAGYSDQDYLTSFHIASE